MLYRFVFDRRLQMKDVEYALGVAYLAMRALHGESQARLDVACSLNIDTRSVVVDGRTEIGHDVAVVFQGLCASLFGQRHFGVQRTPVGSPTPPTPPAASLPFPSKRKQRVASRPRPQRIAVPAKAA
jgi:hypothetical protein